jgi:hypothetical protein
MPSDSGANSQKEFYANKLLTTIYGNKVLEKSKKNIFAVSK